jgi:flagella basal body P-ring formation protein FlgA
MLLVVLLTPVGRVSSSGSLEARIRTEAVGFVSKRVSAPNDSMKITVDIPSVSLDAQEVRDIRYDLLSSRPVVGTVPLRVTLDLVDGAELPFTATARVRLFSTVAVASRKLGRHDTISEQDIRFERREVTLLADGYFTGPERVTGKRARRVISAGTLLRASDIEPIPLIERGSAVTVSVVIGAVTVTSKAKALEDGVLGAAIRVQDVNTRKRLTGIVTGPRLVVLDRTML